MGLTYPHSLHWSVEPIHPFNGVGVMDDNVSSITRNDDDDVPDDK